MEVGFSSRNGVVVQPDSKLFVECLMSNPCLCRKSTSTIDMRHITADSCLVGSRDFSNLYTDVKSTPSTRRESPVAETTDCCCWLRGSFPIVAKRASLIKVMADPLSTSMSIGTPFTLPCTRYYS